MMKKLLIIPTILGLFACGVLAAPQGISNLTALASSTVEEVTLQWTVPEVGGDGTPDNYTVKYATSEILSANFYEAWVSTYNHSWAGSLANEGTEDSKTLTGLMPGTTLYFAMVAVQTAEYGVWNSSSDTLGVYNSAAFAVVPNFAPLAVTGLAATPGNGVLNLQWTKNSEPDISVYQVEASSYSSTEGYNFTATILASGATHQFNSIVNGNTYFYRISAVDTSGKNSGYSDVKTGLPTVNLAAPFFSSNLVAYSTTSINWAWNSVINADGYRVVDMNTQTSISPDLGSSATYYIQTGLTPNTSSGILVQAFNGLIKRDSPSSIKYTFVNPVDSPTTTDIAARSISLSWSTNNNSSFTRYTVQQSSGGSFAPIMSLANSTTCQDNGLIEGATYTYRIFAVNNDSVSAAYVEFETTTVRTLPSAPFIKSTSIPGTKDGDVVLVWTAQWDDDSDHSQGRCSSYLIKYATYYIDSNTFDVVAVSSSVIANIDPPEDQTTTITGLAPGTSYYFAMKSADSSANYSVFSATKMIAAQDFVPNAPTNVTAMYLSSSTVQLTWTLPGFTGQDDRNMYSIYRATTSAALSGFGLGVSSFTFLVNHSLNPTTTACIDTRLNSETTYYYRVATLDTGDPFGYSGLIKESLWSATTGYARTPDTTPPWAVYNIYASTGVAEGEVSLAWSAPGDDGGGINLAGGRFMIGYSSYTLPTAYSITIPTSTPAGSTQIYTVTGLTGGNTYYFRIWAADEADNVSELSQAATSWAQVDITAPGAITGIIGQGGWRKVTLNWAAPGDDGYSTDISNGKFVIRYSQSPTMLPEVAGSPKTIVSTSTLVGEINRYTVRDNSNPLINGDTYYFTIYTYDDRDNLSQVSVTTATVRPFNTPPSAFSLSLPTDNYISSVTKPTFSWQPASDIDSTDGDTVNYILWYSTDSTFALKTEVNNSFNTSYTPSSDLTEDKTYFWKVWARDTDVAQTSSTVRTVKINAVNTPPDSFSLLYPSTGTIVNTATPTVSWYPSYDVDPGDTITYRVEFTKTFASFSTFTVISGLLTTSYTLPALDENAVYYWRVYAEDGVAQTLSNFAGGVYGNYYFFKVNAVPQAPSAFTLTTPLESVTLTSRYVQFKWSTAIDPDPNETVTYNLSYSLFSDFASSTTYSNIVTPVVSFLLPYDNRKYYWRVEAVGSDGLTTTSSQSFAVYIDTMKEAPNAFSLLEPLYSVVISTTQKPWFLWLPAVDNDPGDTVRYYIEVSNDPTFTGSQAIPTGTDTFYQPLENLLDQTTYYWRVRCSGYQGSPPVVVDNSFTFSQTGALIISMINNPPQSFSLQSPAQGAIIDTKTPTFIWQAAVDTDLNDSVSYNLVVSSGSNFSIVLASQTSISTTYYQFAERFFENRGYIWQVTARDAKGLYTVCASTTVFSIPVINKPVPPTGLSGTLTNNEETFNLYFSSVIKNTDNTVVDDLAGYNIYRAVSLAMFDYNTRAAFLPLGTHAWSDNTIQGGKYYYLIRTVDISGVESENSMILESLNPENLSIVSSDREMMVEVSGDVSSTLLSANNKWNKNLMLTITRVTGSEIGKTLRAYELSVQDADLNIISDFKFTKPLTLQYNYTNVEQSIALMSPSKAVPFQQGELSAYWFNGVEYVRIGGFMEESRKRLVVRTTRPGSIELRQVARASAFGLASVTPKKVFTPGVAPFEKMTFTVDNPSGDKVTGQLFDLKGEFVADMQAVGDATSATVTLEWDGNGAAKGVYLYQIRGDNKVISGTLILAK